MTGAPLHKGRASADAAEGQTDLAHTVAVAYLRTIVFNPTTYPMR